MKEGIKEPCRHCGADFTMCLGCWRWHAYCSDRCQEAGYKSTRKAARDTYANSPKGRENQKKRDRRYRTRKKKALAAKKIATDHVSRPARHFIGKLYDPSLGIIRFRRGGRMKIRVQEPRKLIEPLTTDQVNAFFRRVTRYRDIKIAALQRGSALENQ